MEKTRVMKSWSKHNLPAELWREILSRLPVKSLLRFRCVSKLWRSLIDDRYFSQLHLNRFKNNCDETHLFVIQGWKSEFVVRCSNTFKTTARLGSPESHDRCVNTLPSPAPKCLYVVCSNDGLIMLKSCTSAPKTDLMLWNPSIRKSRRLPPLLEDSSYITRYVELGLGYAPTIGDYKHVRLAFHNKSLCWVTIYTIGSGSWKTLQFQGKGRSEWCWHVGINLKPICFRGCLYFVAMNLDSHTGELGSFDLSTEFFAFTSLPALEDPLSSIFLSAGLIVVDGGSSLGMFDYFGTQSSIWVLESTGANNKYWTKRYTFPMGIGVFLYLKKNGDALLGRTQVQSYNAETHEAKILLKNGRGLNMLKVCAYIESLIQP